MVILRSLIFILIACVFCVLLPLIITVGIALYIIFKVAELYQRFDEKRYIVVSTRKPETLAEAFVAEGRGEFDDPPRQTLTHQIPEAGQRAMVADLGGHCEARFRVTDQLGRKYTAKQKIRLN